jgi:hypothetical protein
MNRAQTMTIFAIAVVGLAATAAARAESHSQWPRQCRGDISRQCRDVAKEEDKTILICLQEKEAKLSQGCRKLLQTHGHVPKDESKERRRRRR